MIATRTRSLVLVVAVCTATLLAGLALAGEAVSILGIAWTQQPAPALVVSASGGLAYTEARPEPGVLLIDFPDAIPSAPVSAVNAPEGGLRNATLAAWTEPGKAGSQLRIEHDPGARVTVAALPSGVEIRFATAAGAESRNLTDVLPVADESGVTIHLAGSGELRGKTFTLADPARLVVDLPGVVNRVQRRVHPVAAAGVQRVRVAQFALSPEPIVRVVVDLDTSLPFTLEPRAEGAVLRIGAPASPVVADAAPAVVAVTEPTVVAVETPPAAVSPEPVPAAVEPQPVAEPAVVAAAAAPAEPEPAPAPPVVPAEPEKVVVAQEPPPQRTIVDAPEPEPVAPVPQPVVEAESGTPALTEPPAATRTAEKPAAPAESPWTSTPAAMAEQAAPVTPAGLETREVESQEKQFTGEPISLELKDADIKDVLRTFAKITGLNVVVDPEVTGSVTVQLENVPWDQALDVILKINGLSYQVENNVLRVSKLEKLKNEKEMVAKYLEEAEKSKPMRTVRRVLSYMNVQEASGVLLAGSFMLSKNGSIVADVRNNALTIRDTADRIPGILALLDEMDVPVQQVIIEARVVESSRNFSQSLGISWGFNALGDAEHGTTTAWRFPYSYETKGGVDLGGVENKGNFISLAFADILDAFNLNFVLNAAETNGLARVVSSPKVTAQNNQKAHIQSGVQLPVQTVANNTVTVTYVDATLSLDVTPQITAEGTVILDIDIKKREPYRGFTIVGGQNVPIVTRDAKTKLMVRDGGTTVIGGIYSFSEDRAKDAVPFLGKIPILGNLFRSKTDSERYDELLLFITPRIVKY